MKKIISILLILTRFLVFSQEICDNGIDDDGDGLIDLFDDDCECNGFASAQVVPSLIPNFSFEDFSCCPSGYGNLSCADTWLQASGNTSDYFNSCGFSDPFSVSPFPLPGGGNGYAGFIDGYSDPTYKEYIGSCLLSPMIAGNQYSLSVNILHAVGDNSFNFTIFGSNSCANLPFTGICPTAGWTVLASSVNTFPSTGQWQIATFNFTPTQNINAIILGGGCAPHPLGGSGAYNYYYIDEMILAETSAFSSIDITPFGNWCSENLSLTATTDTVGGSWQWYKDSIAMSGETSPLINISSNNYGAGNFTVKLTIGNKCETTTYKVEIPDYPMANFTFDSVCNNLTTSFTDISTAPSGPITNWNWSFGDGNSATTQNPTNIYSPDGSYNAQLIVTSDIGCKDTITKTVLVYPNPTPLFSVNNVCVNFISILNNSSSINAPDNISSYNWSFGDGNTSTLETPTHLYSTDGNYNIKLLTTSNNGCKDSLTINTIVFPKPIASYTVDDDCVNTIAQFTDNSNVSSGNITNLEWDFGDNSPFDITQNPSHLYANDNTYNTTLIVTTDNGCKDTMEVSTIRHAMPLVSFTSTPDCLYDSIPFTNLTTIANTSTITNYIWNFGDGSSFSTLENPNHIYPQSGAYNVSLIASSNNGCVSDISIPTFVYPIPVANFTNTAVCVNKPPMYFIDISTINNGTINNWEWDFGDGNVDNFPLPNNNYPQSGTYNVQLIVTSNQNCKDTTTLPITVDPKPTALFTSDATEGCSPVCINYTDNSIANSVSIDSWFWNLGNGEANTNQNPTTCYANNDNENDVDYTISLIVKNDKGCYDTISKTDLITSWHNPISSFVATPEEVNMYEAEITTLNNSTGANTYAWDFGDSTFSTEFEPLTIYGDTGIFNIVLAVSTLNNCVDTSNQNVKITPVISIYIPNAFTPNGDGSNDGFIFKGYGIDLTTTQFSIFDRWGTLIYYTENNTPWNGSYKGQKAIQDSYTYTFICKDVFGESHEYIGHFLLLK